MSVETTGVYVGMAAVLIPRGASAVSVTRATSCHLMVATALVRSFSSQVELMQYFDVCLSFPNNSSYAVSSETKFIETSL